MKNEMMNDKLKKKKMNGNRMAKKAFESELTTCEKCVETAKRWIDSSREIPRWRDVTVVGV